MKSFWSFSVEDLIKNAIDKKNKASLTKQRDSVLVSVAPEVNCRLDFKRNHYNHIFLLAM